MAPHFGDGWQDRVPGIPLATEMPDRLVANSFCAEKGGSVRREPVGHKRACGRDRMGLRLGCLLPGTLWRGLSFLLRLHHLPLALRSADRPDGGTRSRLSVARRRPSRSVLRSHNPYREAASPIIRGRKRLTASGRFEDDVGLFFGRCLVVQEKPKLVTYCDAFQY